MKNNFFWSTYSPSCFHFSKKIASDSHRQTNFIDRYQGNSKFLFRSFANSIGNYRIAIIKHKFYYKLIKLNIIIDMHHPHWDLHKVKPVVVDEKPKSKHCSEGTLSNALK